MASSGVSSFWERKRQMQSESEDEGKKTKTIDQSFKKSTSMKISDLTGMRPGEYFTEDLRVVVVFKSNDLKQVDTCTDKKEEILILQMMDETGVLVNGEAWRQNAKHYNQLLEVGGKYCISLGKKQLGKAQFTYLNSTTKIQLERNITKVTKLPEDTKFPELPYRLKTIAELENESPGLYFDFIGITEVVETGLGKEKLILIDDTSNGKLQVRVRSIVRQLKNLKTDTIVRLRGLKFFDADPLFADVFQDTIITVNPECDEGFRLRAYMGTAPVKKENGEQKRDGNNLPENGGKEQKKDEIGLPENGGGENPGTNDGKRKEDRAQ